MQNLKLLSKVALSFVNLSDFDKQMNNVLETIGKHIDVSRIYIFIDYDNGKVARNVYEWCNDGVIPQIKELQNISYETIHSWKNILLNKGRIYSENMYELPKDIIQIVEPQQIKSLIVYPLFIDEKINGFIGFDECRYERRWDERELEILNTISGIISNVYQRKIFEEKEKSILRLFSNIFENNPMPMVISSIKDKKVIKVNPEFSKKVGYSREEIRGKSMEDLNVFIDEDKHNDIIEELKKTGKVKNVELSIRCKDGKILNGLFSGETIDNEGIKSFLTVMVDITEQVQLTKNVEEQHKKLANIIEATHLGTWEWNIQTGETIFNEEWAKIIGYTLDELQPIDIETWINFVHPEDLKKSDELIKKHINGEIDYYECETRMRHKDGNWVWIHDRGKIIERDKEGYPIKMFGTHLDINSRKQAEKALKESEKRFMLALNETQIGLWDWDMINDKVFYSSVWKSMLGYSDDEVENSFDGWRKLWHPEDKPKIEKSMSDYMERKSTHYEVIHRLLHKNGDWKWILTRGGILKDENGAPYRWIGTNTDITLEREQALELERFFSVNLDLLCIADINGYFIKTNKAWTDILGYSSTELEGRKFLDFIHEEDIIATLEAMKKLDGGNEVLQFVNRYVCKDGTYRYIEWRAHPYGKLIYAAARDITERVKYEKKILEMSNRDPLTNVYNRRYIFERAQEIIAKYFRDFKVFSVCILDIDYFKKINDNYGHQAGDYILKEFTKVITKNLRYCDILGRYGGEEFIIIFDNMNKEDSELVVERILEIIRKEIFTFNDININFTFSAGISSSNEFETKEITIDHLVEVADERMYQAKNTGRNKVVII